MSKRRKREADFETKVVEKRENTENNDNSESKNEKTATKGSKKIMFYSIVVAVVFFGVGFFVGPAITGFSVAVPETGNDKFIFISPPGCTNCDALEIFAKDKKKLSLLKR